MQVAVFVDTRQKWTGTSINFAKCNVLILARYGLETVLLWCSMYMGSFLSKLISLPKIFVQKLTGCKFDFL